MPPLTVLDDHSRFLVGLRACHAELSRRVKDHLEAVFERYGLPERMLMDNGSPWRGFHTGLTFWLVRLASSGAWTPVSSSNQGKDERLHHTLKDELLRHQHFSDLQDCQDKFDEWRDVYNVDRPHEALAMQTPASRYLPSCTRHTRGSRCQLSTNPNDILRHADVYGRVLFHARSTRTSRLLTASPSFGESTSNTTGTMAAGDGVTSARGEMGLTGGRHSPRK